MMSITPTAVIPSAPSRPYIDVLGSLPAHGAGVSFGGSWVCFDHMSTEHNPPDGTTGSKRLGPGSFVGVLT
jgi:hypothetical protein